MYQALEIGFKIPWSYSADIWNANARLMVSIWVAHLHLSDNTMILVSTLGRHTHMGDAINLICWHVFGLIQKADRNYESRCRVFTSHLLLFSFLQLGYSQSVIHQTKKKAWSALIEHNPTAMPNYITTLALMCPESLYSIQQTCTL